ncbi:MAG: DUF2141 domain-containing protein [Flavobacteriales bacterium]|nr:DUF2141 domain-containing protein [Flavobacteriales bacterium]
MRFLQYLLLLLLPFSISAQSKLNVEVVLNKPAAGGVLRVALCPSEAAYKTEKGCTLRSIKAEGNTVNCAFDRLVPGTYAVKVFHDVNENRKLDTNWIGWPKEPYGFSNDAPMNMGPPPFKLAAIEVKDGDQTARVRLR